MNLKVIICKVSLNSSSIFSLRINPDKVKDIVFNSINNCYKNEYLDRSYAYAIQKLEIPEYERSNIITGRLIKYRPISELEHWESGEIIKRIQENNIIEKVHFFYEKESEYLFIEERSKVEVQKSIEIFAHLVNYNNMEAMIDINPLKNKDESRKRIKELNKIIFAHFELIPNNPSQKLWGYFEQMAEKFLSTNSIHEFKNSDGLNYTKEFDEAIDDVNEGRSRRYLIGGYNTQGKYNEVRSHDLIRREFKKVDPSDEGRIRGIWEVAKEILNI